MEVTRDGSEGKEEMEESKRGYSAEVRALIEEFGRRRGNAFGWRADLSRVLGMHPSLVTQYANGKKIPGAKAYRRFYDALESIRGNLSVDAAEFDLMRRIGMLDRDARARIAEWIRAGLEPSEPIESLYAERDALQAEVERVTAERDGATARAESAELGCTIAYRRDPTQAEGDAYAFDRGSGTIAECHVPMGNHHGHRCACGAWVWGGPTVCQRCVDRDAVKIALEWKARAEKAEAEVERLRDAMPSEDTATLVSVAIDPDEPPLSGSCRAQVEVWLARVEAARGGGR